MFNNKHIRRRFERAADSFDSADFVHAATRDGLLLRIEPLMVEASTVIDLGAATGAANRDLGKRFRRARIISVDIAHNMLQKARAKKTWLSKSSFAQADASALPSPNESVDVVFSNMLLPWVDDPAPVFTEIARVLRKGGVFAFATLGPDSLQEINRAWRLVDGGAHVNRFLDMHDLGDALVGAGLSDPVLDVDRLSVNYTSSDKLFRDLTAAGGRNALQQRASTLTGKQRYAAMVTALESAAIDGNIALDLELVYGYFPILRELSRQQAEYLSGGQQQMLAIGRALMLRPQLMLLDEPSLGLSPRLVQEISEIIVRLNKEQSVTMLLVEQNAKMALNIGDYGYVMEVGRIVMEDTCERLRSATDIQEFYLGMKDEGVRGRRRWKQRKTWR